MIKSRLGAAGDIEMILDVAELINPECDWDLTWSRDIGRNLVLRDVAQFNPAAPPMTAAKIQMIDASKSPIDEIHEHLIENMEGDLATRKQLTVHLERVARSLGFDQIEHSPQNMVRRIWRQMQSLQPTNRNGYRVTIDTVREEIRALRRPSEWLSQMIVLSREQIVEEMKKHRRRACSVDSGSVS